MGRGRITGHVARIPVSAIESVAYPRAMQRVEPLVQAYRSGATVPAIPVRMTKHGQLHLDGDGNHRLAAARLAGLSHVEVIIDARDAGRLRKFAVP